MKVNMKDYLTKGAEILRSSERMVARNQELCRDHEDGPFYNPEWTVSLEQDEVEGLLRNLRDAAGVFDLLAQNPDAALSLVAAHLAAGEATPPNGDEEA